MKATVLRGRSAAASKTCGLHKIVVCRSFRLHAAYKTDNLRTQATSTHGSRPYDSKSDHLSKLAQRSRGNDYRSLQLAAGARRLLYRSLMGLEHTHRGSASRVRTAATAKVQCAARVHYKFLRGLACKVVDLDAETSRRAKTIRCDLYTVRWRDTPCFSEAVPQFRHPTEATQAACKQNLKSNAHQQAERQKGKPVNATDSLCGQMAPVTVRLIGTSRCGEGSAAASRRPALAHSCRCPGELSAGRCREQAMRLWNPTAEDMAAAWTGDEAAELVHAACGDTERSWSERGGRPGPSGAGAAAGSAKLCADAGSCEARPPHIGDRMTRETDA
eukprot:3614847-Pleurochrysis_carterae.AAC.2